MFKKTNLKLRILFFKSTLNDYTMKIFITLRNDQMALKS
jgi:hypothetical protein